MNRIFLCIATSLFALQKTDAMIQNISQNNPVHHVPFMTILQSALDLKHKGNCAIEIAQHMIINKYTKIDWPGIHYLIKHPLENSTHELHNAVYTLIKTILTSHSISNIEEINEYNYNSLKKYLTDQLVFNPQTHDEHKKSNFAFAIIRMFDCKECV